MKSNIIKRILCLTTLLRTLIGVRSQSPQNAIAVLNGQETFNCEGLPYSKFIWYLNSILGTGGVIIADDCKIRPSFRAKYTVEKGSNFCNLIVSNVDMQHAGTYSCLEHGSEVPSSAILTVINPDANVKVHNSTALTEGEPVNISCSLAYNTSHSDLPRLIPTLSWEVPIGQIATALISDTKANIVTSNITIILQKPDLPIFQCLVNFTLTGVLSDEYAKNIPSSPVTSWNTPKIDGVLSRKCNITNENIVISGICRLSNLSCVASANSSAKYRWVDVDDPQPWNSLNDEQFFPIAEDGRTYRCTANYVIKGEEFRIWCTITVPNQSLSPRPCKFAHENAIDIYSTDSDCNNEVRPISCSCKNGIYLRLVCNATNVFPEPTYLWENEDGHFLGNGPSYNATSKGIIKCVAVTVIAGVDASLSRIVSITDCLGNDENEEDREEPSPTLTSCSNQIISMWVAVTVLAFLWHSC